MALLTRFATWIVKSARGSKEVLPTTKQIERFDIELTAEAVQNELFDALSGDAAGLLRRLYRFASDLESESVPWGFFGEEEKRAGGPEWALDDLEVLRYLDLVQVDEAAEEMAVTIELRGPIAKAFGGGSVPA